MDKPNQGTEYWTERPIKEMVNDWGGKTYLESVDHPHRKLIVDALKKFSPLTSVFEAGCNSGPNLLAIHREYPRIKLGGCDLSKGAIKQAVKGLPRGDYQVGSVTKLEFPARSYDVVIADAVLMYVNYVHIALDEMCRVAKKGIIIVDWYSETEEVKDYHWARNYKDLLERRGYKVETYKLKEKDWPNKSWIKNGMLFIAHLQ